VLSIDAPANRLVVGPGGALEAREALVENLRFPSGAPEGSFRANVRVRHRGVETPATVVPDGEGSARVLFDAPVRAVAPGQSCVFYNGEVVVGGGTIRKKL
jgi:tRNA-specific 2-thiouridylase